MGADCVHHQNVDFAKERAHGVFADFLGVGHVDFLDLIARIDQGVARRGQGLSTCACRSKPQVSRVKPTLIGPSSAGPSQGIGTCQGSSGL